jgi:hypothetical protein
MVLASTIPTYPLHSKTTRNTSTVHVYVHVYAHVYSIPSYQMVATMVEYVLEFK